MLRATYSSPGTVKKLLRSLDELMKQAGKGDQVAHSIYLDLDNALYYEGVLSFKQRKYLKLWLDGYMLIDIAAMHRRDISTISRTINKGVSNISVFLQQ